MDVSAALTTATVNLDDVTLSTSTSCLKFSTLTGVAVTVSGGSLISSGGHGIQFNGVVDATSSIYIGGGAHIESTAGGGTALYLAEAMLCPVTIGAGTYGSVNAAALTFLDSLSNTLTLTDANERGG